MWRILTPYGETRLELRALRERREFLRWDEDRDALDWRFHRSYAESDSVVGLFRSRIVAGPSRRGGLALAAGQGDKSHATDRNRELADERRTDRTFPLGERNSSPARGAGEAEATNRRRPLCGRRPAVAAGSALPLVRLSGSCPSPSPSPVRRPTCPGIESPASSALECLPRERRRRHL